MTTEEQFWAAVNWLKTVPDPRAKLLASQAALVGDMREALWICVEHNALHFGETHNTVVQGRAALAGAAPAAQGDALDDAAVDRFAAAMKAKLAYKRGQGYDGWDDKALCSQDDLSRWLREHVDKGDAVDVANFAMMLHQRGEWIVDPDADHATRTAQPQQDDEQ